MIGTAATIIAPLAYDAVASFFKNKSQSKQSEADRAQQNEQFLKIINLQTAAHEEGIRRFELTEERKEAQWDAIQSQHQAGWLNTTELQAPYRAASRAILGRTMQMNVPAYDPRYSMEDSRPRRKHVYQDYINPESRSA